MLQHTYHNILPPKGKYKGQKWKQHYNRNSPHKNKDGIQTHPHHLTTKTTFVHAAEIQHIEMDFIAQQRSLNVNTATKQDFHQLLLQEPED